MKFKILTTLLGLGALAVALIAVIPNWRQSLRASLASSERKVLGSVKGDLSNDGITYIINKVQDGEDIILEVFQQKEDTLKVVSRIELPNAQEAYFTFMGEATNLALANFDDDANLEIVSPTFDKNHVARLNVFKFNSQTNSFLRIDPKQILGFE